MLNRTHPTALGRALVIGFALVLSGCNIDGALGRNDGRLRVVVSRDIGSQNAVVSLSTTSPQSPLADNDDDDDDDDRQPWSFESANVTLSSILARTLDGVLVNLEVDLPVAVDVVKIDGGREVQLPDGILPAGIYDQVVLVITAVQGVAPDGTVITIQPPGGGWTAVVPICELEVVAGQTATVAITLNVRRSFVQLGPNWSFQPRFRSLAQCAS